MEHDALRVLAYFHKTPWTLDGLYPHHVPEHFGSLAALLAERAEALAARGTSLGHCGIGDWLMPAAQAARRRSRTHSRAL